MSSEHLASAQNELKGNLGGAWNILDGAQGQYQDLGIARRFGAAAAAYSLRDIGAMNGRVVKARRDVGETSDPEEDFSASQVQSGALEDYINGKLEDTLPADVATAAAAYSLRKVKATYSGDAVRIRRSSDDVEVDVAFDSDDKVSASSAITNIAEQGGEIGSTTATDLNGFLNETLTVGVAVEGGDGADRPDSFSNATNSSFTATVTEVAGGYFPYRTNLNDVIVVSFDIVLTGSASPSLTTSDGIDTVQNRSNSEVISSSGSYTKTLTCDQNNGTATHIRFADSDDGTFAVTNFRVVSHTHQAFVHTWYDQAGSNNAVQTTAANQPKIAENGALITKQGQPSLKFRGTDSTPIYLDSPANITANFSFFIAAQPAADGTTSGSAGNEKRNHTLWSQGATFHMAGINSDFTNGFRHGSTILSYSAGLDFNTNLNLHSLTNGSSNVDYFGNAVNKINTTNSTSTATSYDIGRKVNITSHNTRGYISEFIHYNSDQSANRFKIESNINNYYSLYNDANETSATAFSFSGERSGGTTSSDGLNGFTLDVQTAAAYAGFQLSQKVANADKIFVSFNAVLTGGNDGASSPQFKLRSGSISGTGTSDTYDVVAGFNGFKVTSTNDDSEFISFSEGDDNRIFTISDFKISRIARNGFVETWYDQSGNSRPLIQTTATEQPSIVENGGFVGGVKADVATSNDTMQNLQVSTDGTTANFGTDDWANGGTKLGLMYVGSVLTPASPTSTSVLWGGGRGVSSFQGGGVSIQFIKAGTDSYRLRNERQGLSPSGTTLSLSKDIASNDAIIYGTADNRDFILKVNDSATSDTEEADLDTREDTPISLFGAYDQNSGRYYQRSSSGVCKECYLFSGDNITEVDTISLEINKHYNIY